MSDEQPQKPIEETTPSPADTITPIDNGPFSNLGLRLLGASTFLCFAAITVWAVLLTQHWWPIAPISILVALLHTYSKVKLHWYAFARGISGGFIAFLIVVGLLVLLAGLCWGMSVSR